MSGFIENRFDMFFSDKSLVFRTKTGECLGKAVQYLKALYTTEKSHRNIEKMTDGRAKKDYYKIQHFISESPWSAKEGMSAAAKDVNRLLASEKHVALIIDESGEEKKGLESVGVGHQYCGNLGKTCNSQVAVYGSLASENRVSIIDTRLYLPKSWTDDAVRCKKVGIPDEDVVFKTKTELALEIIIAQRAAGIRFDWVTADGLYGNDSKLLTKLEELNELYVIDIHSDQLIYLQAFELKIKERSSAKGKTPTRLLPDQTPINVSTHIASLDKRDWAPVKLRRGTKGELRVETYVKQVYVWDKVSNTCSGKLLVVSRKQNKNQTEAKGFEYKYAFSNASIQAYSLDELAYMQCQRFWIEHAFREAKQELGMADYQVRGWLAWHHHMALVMMAMAFTLSEKMFHQDSTPLLSASDVRLLLIYKFAQTSQAKMPIMHQIKNRHIVRQEDIENWYRRQKNGL